MRKTKFNTLFLSIQEYIKSSEVQYNVGLFEDTILLIKLKLLLHKLLKLFSFLIKYNMTQLLFLGTETAIKIVITDPAFSYPKVLPFDRNQLNLIDLIIDRLDKELK